MASQILLNFDENAIRLGRVRHSQSSNPVLLRNQQRVGATPRPAFQLPSDIDPNYTYGDTEKKKPSDSSIPSTAACLAGWEVHTPSRKKDVLPPTDHVRLNKLALRQRLVTPHEQSQFVKSHRDVRCKPKARVTRATMHHHKSGSQTARETRSDDVVYGRPPPRAPTPLGDVMQHNFQKLWLKEQSEQQHEMDKRMAAKRRAVHEKQRKRLKELLEVSHARQAITEQHRLVESGGVVRDESKPFKLRQFAEVGPSAQIRGAKSPRKH